MKAKIKLDFAKDLSYNVIALVIINIVIQFVIYPYLNNVIGEEAFGTVLYLMSIVSVVSGSFGLAVNNTRLVAKTKLETKNGDYNSILGIFCLVSILVAVVSLYFLGMLDIWNGICFAVLTIVTLLRHYSDVEFRVVLNYKKYFVYYMLISGGYLIGVLLYKLTNNWYILFIVGETIAVLSVVFLGTIYKGAFQCSENRKLVWKMTITVAGSYLINSFFLNLDRIVLQNTMEATL
jgi:O-antigen/teichoic acid export membrane protein